MRKLLILVGCMLLSLSLAAAKRHHVYNPTAKYTKEEQANIDQFKAMHHDIIELHHTDHMDNFYDQNFEMFSNKEHFSYSDFKRIFSNTHKNIYKETKVTYRHIFAKKNKVSALVNFDIVKLDGKHKSVDAMVIAEMYRGKIKKIYELSLAR